MAQFELCLTEAGREMLVRAVGGEKAVFEQIVLGDGGYSGNLAAVEAVISPKAEIPVQAVEKAGNRVTLEGILALNDVAVPFYWREIGVYARMGEERCLCIYGNAREKADYIAASGGVLDEKVIRLSVQVGEGEIQADPASLVYAKAEMLEKVGGQLAAHTGNENIHTMASEKLRWTYQNVQTLSHSKSGTVHQLTGISSIPYYMPEYGGAFSCVFKATAAFAAGDTFTVDGVAYTVQLSNGEAAEANLFVSGATVPVVVDTSGKKVNFKAGGGLSNAKLALATATAADVKSGKTFYAGNQSLKTGTLTYSRCVMGSFADSASNNKFISCGFRPSTIILWAGTGGGHYEGGWICLQNGNINSQRYAYFYYDSMGHKAYAGASSYPWVKSISDTGFTMNPLNQGDFGNEHAKTWSYIAIE